MSKSRTGTDWSDQTVTWASWAVAEALFTENSVLMPFGLIWETGGTPPRSHSNYGRSKVAAGTLSIVGTSANAWPPRANRATTAMEVMSLFMLSNLLMDFS